MNSHAPTLSNAPPVSACPLVHPRASTAPAPTTAPPAPAAPSRGDTPTCGPRSTLTPSRPASAAEHHPPIITPRISTTSQSRNSPPASRGVAKNVLLDATSGATPRPVAAAAVANAPLPPSPRPAITNDASSTSPSATPARYGSAYGRGAPSLRALIGRSTGRRADLRPAAPSCATIPGTIRRTAAPGGR